MMFIILYVVGIVLSVANFIFLKREYNFRVACGLHLCLIVPASYNLAKLILNVDQVMESFVMLLLVTLILAAIPLTIITAFFRRSLTEK